MQQEQGEVLKVIADLICDRTAIRFNARRLLNLGHQLRERQAVCGISDLADYARHLANDRDELDLLIDRISTKETYFFRIPGQFRGLSEMVLPRLEEEMLDRVYAGMAQGMIQPAPLRIWSAGCATGQEPYSIAMALLDRLRHPRAWRIELLATDLSREALVEAEAGRYREEALKHVPAEQRSRYFKPFTGGAEVSPELRRMVSFRRFNLRDLIVRGIGPQLMEEMDGSRETRDVSGRYDIVFCRNVMIYFDFEAQQALVDRLYDCVRPGGWLFTGDAELLHVYQHRFETIESFETCWYRKPGGNP